MEKKTVVRIGITLVIALVVIGMGATYYYHSDFPGSAKSNYQENFNMEITRALSNAYNEANRISGFYADNIVINATGEMPIEEIVNITINNPTNHTLTFERDTIKESYALGKFSNIGYFIYHENEWIPAKYCQLNIPPCSVWNTSLKIVIDNIASAIKGMNHSIDIQFEIFYFLEIGENPYAWPFSWPILFLDVIVIT